MDITQFIHGMPKVELHLHIEGSLEPEMMFDLARRNKVAIPFASADEVREAYNFSNLQDFLDIYYQGMNVLRTRQDFYDLTMAYLAKMKDQNVHHVEIFFDPQGHTERGIPFDVPLTGIKGALADGERQFGITSKLIMCFLRHLSEESAMVTLDEAMAYRDQIDGVGLDSSENGHPPEKFLRVFERARAAGFKLVAHAGEEGPPAYVRQAIDGLKIDRIDHGNRSLEDDELVSDIIRRGLGLTVCPLSNLKLCGVSDLRQHPLKTMLDRGLNATINSDDPAYFGGYMNENFVAVAGALNLGVTDIVQLAANAIDVSFMTLDQKRRALERLQDYVNAAPIWKPRKPVGRPVPPAV